MSLTIAQIEAKLSQFLDPELGRDYVTLKAVRDCIVEPNGAVKFTIELPYPAKSHVAKLESQLTEHLKKALPTLSTLNITFNTLIKEHSIGSGVPALPQIKNIIAVGSGKGGVGKSTVAVNLAAALMAEGASVGLLDADIYGPSQPLMLGLQGAQPKTPDGKQLIPLLAHGMQVMSIGFLVDNQTPMIWRGPMVSSALQQMAYETAWHALDYLIVDLPPGTGDIQLTLAQKIPVNGAVIVTQPQELALLDVRRAIGMFQKVKVPVLGVVENMSFHQCSACGHIEQVFGQGGAEALSQQYGVPVLANLPLKAAVCAQSESGVPFVLAQPDDEISLKYKAVARKVAASIALQSRDKSRKFPKIVIE